jgi:hypothetical protein
VVIAAVRELSYKRRRRAMIESMRGILHAAAVVAVAAVTACGSSHPATADAPAPVVDAYRPVDVTLAVIALSVSPPTTTLDWPLTAPLQVLATYSDDAQLDVTPFATYATDAPAVAEAAAGVVQSLGPGSATITATYMGAVGSAVVTIEVPTLAVATSDGVDQFDASASGSAAPRSSIRGSATTIQHGCGIAELNGELFVVDDVADAIDVWETTDAGNIAPERTIATSFTPVSIAAAGSAIYVGAVDGVRAFAATASGAATPIQTISGSATTIASGAGVAVFEGEIYVVNTSGSVAVFPVGADGNVAPSRVIAGSATGLDNPVGISVGGAESLEFVTADELAGQVQAFVPTGSGNAVPFGNFSGAQTELVSPASVAADQTVVFVGTPSTQTIEVLLLSNDFGDFPPLQTITGEDVQGLTVY